MVCLNTGDLKNWLVSSLLFPFDSIPNKRSHPKHAHPCVIISELRATVANLPHSQACFFGKRSTTPASNQRTSRPKQPPNQPSTPSRNASSSGPEALSCSLGLMTFCSCTSRAARGPWRQWRSGRSAGRQWRQWREGGPWFEASLDDGVTRTQGSTAAASSTSGPFLVSTKYKSAA